MSDAEPTPRDGTPVADCPICSAGVGRWRTKRTNAGEFAIDRCRGCGFAFVNPPPSPDFLFRFYETSGHTVDGSDTAETLEQVLERETQSPNSTVDAPRLVATIVRLLDDREVTAPRRMLDVGCGHGFFMKEAQRSGFEPVAIELASNERRIAEQMTSIRPLNVAFEAFESPPASFSAILMSHILEHAHDINLWMRRARELLCANGVLAVAVPNFASLNRRLMQEREAFIIPPAHLNYFTPGNLRRLLEKHGFVVEEVQQVSRIPIAALESRLSFLGAPGLRVLGGGVRSILRLVDLVHLGMMFDIYARRCD